MMTARLAHVIVLGAGAACLPIFSSPTTAEQRAPVNTPASIWRNVPSTLPLIDEDDLEHVGALRVPPDDFGGPQNAGFNYGGTALAYNPARNSLFIVGHDHHQLTAEISLPGFTKSARLADLKTAAVLQNFRDASNGLIKSFDQPSKLGGQMVFNGRLFGTVYTYYEGEAQRPSHFVRSLDLASSEVRGLFEVAGRTGFVSGYMATVPEEWRTALGGPALTGNCCLPIISRTSWGPSAFAFDPDALGDRQAASVPLLYYDQEHPTLGTWDNRTVQNPLYNMTTTVAGMVFVHGTRSLLFFGRTGAGRPCYGMGTTNQAIDRTPVAGAAPGDIHCYDPEFADKGTHAYPYVPFVWAFDALDLEQVRRRRKQPYQVRPYATWQLRLPFKALSTQIGGVAYNPTAREIYLSQMFADSEGPARLPVIHAFKVK